MFAPGSKIPFTEAELTAVLNYLGDELPDAMLQHEEREARLDEWQRCYDGDPKEQKRFFPWPGAANIEIPIIGMHVDSIVARIVNTIFSTDPFWTLRALHKDVDEVAKPLERYLDWSRSNEFNLYKNIRPWANELTKYGWAWLKPCWETYTQTGFTNNEVGIPTLKEQVIRRPAVYHVLAKDVIVQAGIEDETQAEWIAHRFRLTDNQVWQRGYDKIWDDATVKLILDSKEDASRHHDSVQSSVNQPRAGRERLNTFYEIQVNWRYNNVPCSMVWVYHKPLNKLLRAVFNPYGFRTLKKAQFIEREGRLEGFGIAKRLYHIQHELSTLHRQQLDNATLANTRFFVGRRNVVRPGTQIWPGRFLAVGDPERDIKAMQLGDIYQSQGVLEMRALSYAERASGVSDYQLGRESSVAGSGATATGTLAVIQEGNRRFDLNIRDARDLLSGVGRDILLLNQMFRPRGLAYFVQGSDGQYTEEALSLPPDFEVGKMAVELTASTATVNRAVEKQELIALLGITEKYYQGVFQAGMILMNPQMPGEMKEFVAKSVQGSKLIMDKIVQAFDVKPVDEVVPGLVPDANAGGLPGGSPGMPNGAEANGRLAQISQLYQEYINASSGGPGGQQ